MKQIFIAVFLMVTTALLAQNNVKDTLIISRPDAHAPISIMGDHTHKKGEFMFSYRFMLMNMDNIKQGTDDKDYNSLLMPNGGDYMVAPIEMPMQMHMLGAMYAINDDITLMAMLNYIDMSMDHVTAMGETFTTNSNGFGDIKVTMLYNVFKEKSQSLHTQLGVVLPTGNIESKDVTAMSSGNEVILPYPMQIGSGTFGTELGLTYTLQRSKWSFGSQLKGLLRFGKNNKDYRLGNQYGLNNWIAFKVSDWISFSGRIEGLRVSKIEGSNSELNPMMVITADANNSGATFLNSGVGFNILIPSGSFKDFRFGFEFATPLLQDVEGIQLKQRETIIFGLQYML